MKRNGNPDIIESWEDSTGKKCYPGAIIEYECDLINALKGNSIERVKSYAKIVQSKYGWWGGLPLDSKDGERPNPMWTYSVNTGGFRILENKN